MKANIAAFILMLIAVPLAGELKFYPFQDQFRVSLGTPVFFFFLLWIQRVPPALSGFVAGMNVVAFRMLWDHMLGTDASYAELFQLHYPVFFYYLAYASLFQFLKLNHAPYRPLRVGALSILIEIIATFVELSFRHSVSLASMDFYELSKIVLFAVIRSFFVLGFFNMIQLRQSILNEEQQRKEKERILLLVSNLFEESVQLKKTLQHAEDITRDCYDLYRSLQSADLSGLEGLSQKALRISGQVHEIKKDNQRIAAGLSKMIADQGSSDYMRPVEIGHLIVRSNEKYAASLGKDIEFDLDADETLPPLHVYTVLSFINNLAANAAEAIESKGTVHIYMGRLDDTAEFRVSDNGPGIPPKKKHLIFTPGYTSKYDISGKPSTGMGLYYIQQAVSDLQGHVECLDEKETGETVFIIRLPIDKLTGKG